MQADHDDDHGRPTHSWWLRSGRLLLIAEFQSTSPIYGVEAARRLLSTIPVNHSAVQSVPLETSVFGYVKRFLGTIAGIVRRYHFQIAFLVLVMLIALLLAGRI